MRDRQSEDIQALIERSNQAYQRGIHFLAEEQESDGSFRNCPEDLAGYYKAVLAFAACGNVQACARCIRFIKAKFLTGSFELGSGKNKTRLIRMDRNLSNYMDAWVAVGAWVFGDLPLARAITGHLKKLISAKHGGVRTGTKVQAGTDRFDLATTASCGRAFLFSGDLSSLEKVAGFIAHALENQTEPTSGLNLSFEESWEPTSPNDPAEDSYHFFDFSQKGEKVWFPAFSVSLLVEAYQATGKQEYLRPAEIYYGYLMRIPEFRDRTLDNGKSAWAAGLLYQTTRKPEYFDALVFITENVLRRQLPNGEFASSGVSARAAVTATTGKLSGDQVLRRLERTAEFTYHCNTLTRILSTL